jgi:hypothetical protein
MSTKKINLANKPLEKFLREKRSLSKFVKSALNEKSLSLEDLENDPEYTIKNSFLWTWEELDFWNELHEEFTHLKK